MGTKRGTPRPDNAIRNKARAKQSTCHPDRPHRAKGLCDTCYNREYFRKTHKGDDTKPYAQVATCHPDRPHIARGLCRECYDELPFRKEYNEKYSAANRRRDLLKHRYGLTLEQFDELNTKQGGVCAICHQPPRGKMTNLSVDHNHTTGEIRGLLCVTCNRAVGYLDNADWLSKATKYLTP